MRIPFMARRKARIEIIPLIDIVFFLLATFVMVSFSMIQNQGMAVNLPKASTGAAEERKNSVTVTVKENGEIFLNQEPVAITAVGGRIEAMRRDDPNLKVFINADEKSVFANAVAALDEVRKAGVTKVSIQTKRTAWS